jgi:ABC-type glutathione transport system ATPase component
MLLRVHQLRVTYDRAGLAGEGEVLRAVDDVSFQLAAGETLGIIGESGSGKSSIVRALMRLVAAAGGSVQFNGQSWLELTNRELRRARAQMQLVVQHPHAALDPQQRVGEIVAEPLRVFSPQLSVSAQQSRVLALLQRVGLGLPQLDLYPHELSGGQAQRVGIARALISGPALLVCDEPLSALDVSIKAQITNLLRNLLRDPGRSMLLVSHELPAIRYLCQRVLVLYQGQVMEQASTADFFAGPRHPYSRELLNAHAGCGTSSLNIGNRPVAGCPYTLQCRWATSRCAIERPALRAVGDSLVACHVPEAYQFL